MLLSDAYQFFCTVFVSALVSALRQPRSIHKARPLPRRPWLIDPNEVEEEDEQQYW